MCHLSLQAAVSKLSPWIEDSPSMTPMFQVAQKTEVCFAVRRATCTRKFEELGASNASRSCYNPVRDGTDQYSIG